MQYYWLIQSTGDDIGKASSQVKGMKDGYNLYANDSVWKLPLFEKPNFEPNFNALQLNSSAKLTDIIIPTGLISMTGFFLNEKVKDIFKDYKLPNHIYYKATVVHKNKVYDNYYWIQFTQEMSDTIDYKNSMFDLKEAFGWQNWIEVEGNLKFNNIANLIEFYRGKSSMKDIIPTSLKFNVDNDMLCFRFFGNSILISEGLKYALNSLEIKGIELVPF